jgi:uncharacterized protein (DUF302 family)
MTFGIKRALSITYDEALRQLPEALKSEGFGILTEIDMKETLHKKLGVDFRRYKIIGACNPPLAHQALSADLEVGLMLPCNVIVYEADNNRAVVVAVDPTKTMATSGDATLTALTETVKQKLSRAIDAL